MASGGEEDGSKCPICFEMYKEPKALVCLHSFCETCIHEYVLKSQEKSLLCKGIECPLCRFVTPVEDATSPETWAKGLRTNFALAALLDSARINVESIKQEENHCQPCLLQKISNPASAYCSVCNERLCEKCKNVHDNLQFTKDHESIDIGSKANLEFSTTLRAYQKCEQHSKEIEFYCKDDNTLCCSTCAIVGHRACKGLVELSEMVKDRRNQLQGCLVKKQIAELENSMKLSSSHLASENKHLTKQATELLTEWGQVREKMNQKLDEFEDKLKEEILAVQTTQASDNMRKAVQCNDIAGEMRRFLRMLELSEEKYNEEQQYVVRKKIFDEFKHRQSETEQKFADIKSLKLSLVLSQPIQDLLSMSTDGVSVEAESTTKYIPKCAAKTLSILAKSVIKQATDDEVEPFYTGLGFLDDGRIVAVDHKNNKCILMDECLNKIAEKCLPVRPQGLAVTQTDCVIITSGQEKKLCFYQVYEDNTIDDKSVIPVNYSCGSISIVDDNKCVVSTYGTSVEPVHLVTFDGDFSMLKVDFEGISFERNTQTKSTYDEAGGELLITEKEQNTVHVYSIARNDHVEINDNNVKKPKGIAHYMNDLYFICSSETNSIVQLSSEGGVLVTNVLHGMTSPHSLSFSSDREKMVVSNNSKGEKMLLLFEIR